MIRPSRRPRVSVTIPCYLSHRTVAACLEGLRGQSYRDFDVTVVDSSPDDRTAAEIDRFPEVRLIRSSQRLLPHAARNRAAASSAGELLVFTDPDVYPEPTWLERLVASHDATGQPTVGALACWGSRWLDHGIHLCKFAKFLPGGPARTVDTAPTANFLCPRAIFERLGGFRDELFLADHELSLRLIAAGEQPWIAPSAVVFHHHTSTLREFLVERWRRGRLFAGLRLELLGATHGTTLLYLAVTILPVRWLRILFLTVRDAARAGQLGVLLATLLVVKAGHLWWLAGEASIYAAALTGRRPAAGSGPASA